MRVCTVVAADVADMEVVETCQWLRAAGFPQYARIYEGDGNLLVFL